MRRVTMTIAVTATLALSACGGEGGPGPTAAAGNESEPSASSTSEGADGSSRSGGADSEDSATSPPEDTSSATSTSSTSTDTGTPFDPQEFTSRLQEAVDGNPTVAIEVDVTLGDEQGVSASGVQDLEKNALEMDVDMGGQQLGYRLVDGQYYLSQPPKWVPVTEDSTNPLIQQTLEQVQMLSMRKQFDAFIAGVQKAGDKGTEEIDGVTTTHYTATVDTDKANKTLGQGSAPGTPETLIYDVWLDANDLIRQMTFTQDTSTATMTATGWGEPVSIATPKDSEIAQPN